MNTTLYLLTGPYHGTPPAAAKGQMWVLSRTADLLIRVTINTADGQDTIDLPVIGDNVSVDLAGMQAFTIQAIDPSTGLEAYPATIGFVNSPLTNFVLTAAPYIASDGPPVPVVIANAVSANVAQASGSGPVTLVDGDPDTIIATYGAFSGSMPVANLSLFMFFNIFSDPAPANETFYLTLYVNGVAAFILSSGPLNIGNSLNDYGNPTPLTPILVAGDILTVGLRVTGGNLDISPTVAGYAVYTGTDA